MANETQLAARAGAVEKDIARLASGMTLKQTVTLVVGFGLLAAVAVFYYWGLSQIRERLEPKELVNTARGLALEQMPVARRELVSYAREQLPKLAEYGSKTGLEQLPAVREQLEGMLMAGADKALTDAREPLKATMQQMVRKNKKLLAEGAVELSKSPADADRFLKSVAEIAEKELGADMDKTVGTMAAAVEGFGDTLRNAGIDTRRSSLGVMLREILSLAKRLSIEMHEALPETDKTQLKEGAKELGGAKP